SLLMEEIINEDKRLLQSIGSYAEIGRKTGNSPQCVFNWSKRGIPARIKLQYPDLFLNPKKTDDQPK
ncbi:TPA: hypothetical protein ACFJJC_002222, partial [Neisseria gonorrhoeae]